MSNGGCWGGADGVGGGWSRIQKGQAVVDRFCDTHNDLPFGPGQLSGC
jgi:hypothetical protein